MPRQTGDHEHELVAALARHGVVVAHAIAQSLGHVLEQCVAHVVAQAVVDELELVQIHQRHRDRRLMPLRLSQCLVEAIGQQRAVGQTGQRIVVRLVQELLLEELAVGNILHRALEEDDLARGIADGVGALGHPDDAAVLAVHPRLEVADGAAAAHRMDELLAASGIDVQTVEAR